MDKDWRTILRFAAVGLVSAALVMAVQFLPNSSFPNYSLMAVSILLCPASLLAAPLFAWFFEAAEVGTGLFYVLWAFTVLANGAMYAVVGAAYVGLRKKREGPAAS
jgi:hypothetical protein